MQLKNIILKNYCLLKGIPENYGEESFLKKGYKGVISSYKKHLEQHTQYLQKLEKAQEKDYPKVIEENFKEQKRELQENSLNHLKLIEKQKEALNKTDFLKSIKAEQVGKDSNYTLQDAVFKTLNTAEKYHKNLLNSIEKQRQNSANSSLPRVKSLKEERERVERELSYFRKKIERIKNEVKELRKLQKELKENFDFTEV